MLEFLRAHPYLCTNTISIAFLLITGWFVLSRVQWKMMVLCGLANTPCFPFLLFLENRYWSPVRLGGWALGIEDALCSFAVAAMAWFVVGLFFADRIPFRVSWKTLLMRYAMVATVSGLTFLLLSSLMGLSGMTALLLTCLILAAILFLVRKSLWPVVLVSLLGFPLFYLSVVKVYFLIWPEFIHQWNSAPPWGRTVLGIPLGEIAWSVVFSIYWPLFVLVIAGRPREGDVCARQAALGTTRAM
jgi:hypothetical protein